MKTRIGNRGKAKAALLLLGWLCAAAAAARVTLPAVLSDGMVVQRGRPMSVWGKADAGEAVAVTLCGVTRRTVADAEGQWQVELPAMEAGGPYDMDVNGERVKDVLVGDVWLCGGQSNMELTVARVADLYGGETADYENPMIRYVKTPRVSAPWGPQDDVEEGMEWRALTREAAPSFSALAYFFAQEMWRATGVPVGIVNSSWGGSTIEAWMSGDALQAFPHCLRERDIMSRGELREAESRRARLADREWWAVLCRDDAGRHAEPTWQSAELDDSGWETVDVFSPALGHDGGRAVCGAHWLRQSVRLTSAQAAAGGAVLRLGCLVDADSVYVNGTFVGSTSYRYPPRIYPVPDGVLREGPNTVCVRLVGQSGAPSFVDGKLYALLAGGDTVRLSHAWRHKLGCEMPEWRGGENLQNVPSGMFNGMIAPLRRMAFRGALWYQGESNAERPQEYAAMLQAMMADWRGALGDVSLPFFVVQLPDYMLPHAQPAESSWAALRDAQRRAVEATREAWLVTALGLGEWNDIHPLNKKELARRVALQVRKEVYGERGLVASGPECVSMAVEDGRAVLRFAPGTDSLVQPEGGLKGFAVAGEDGVFRWAEARVADGSRVELRCDRVACPVRVRYAWDDNPAGANLANRAGLPAATFEVGL